MPQHHFISYSVVADLTTANANVFYELGVRHAARSATTLTIFAKQQPIPFDVNFLRSLPYELGKNNRFGKKEACLLREALTSRLQNLRDLAHHQVAVDSPLFDLLREWKPGDIARARLKTDVFREQVQLNESLKGEMAAIRAKGKKKNTRTAALQELLALRKRIGRLDSVEAATAIDIMLSFRALEDWNSMISVFDDMPEILKRQILVREQAGFAYNRCAGASGNPADRDEAFRILAAVEEQQGPGSETCGLIGRIYKDRWNEALKNNDGVAAAGYLKKSIDAYHRGFMADQRDAFPGINAVTLLDIRGDEKSLELKNRLLPVVRFAVEQRLTGKNPDYWDHATMLELAVLDNDYDRAGEYLADAVAAVRESWESGTTADNLKMIERARNARGEDTAKLSGIITRLTAGGT